MVNGQDSFDALQLDDELVFDNQVDTIDTIQPQTAVCEGQGHLSAELETVARQLLFEAVSVRMFKESGTERTMDGDGVSDNRLHQWAGD